MQILNFSQGYTSVSGEASKTLLFEDKRSRALMAQIERLAPSNVDVLVIGETGTGKELAARQLHRLSNRSRGPFTPVNCAALSETLFESELFGHERGAFTGAVGARAGWFESANGGTLFLDEVGDLPLSMQVKLLRVLQEREVVRVGSRQPIKLDVRVIAATNIRLEMAVRAGHFREDLYYRLRVASLELPALRERPGDILPLSRHFIEMFCRKLDRRLPELAPAAEQVLSAHQWPGNIRELENVVHNALIVCRNDLIRAEDLQIASLPAHAVVRPDEDSLEACFARLDTALTQLFERNLPALYDQVDQAVMRSAFRYCHRNQVQTSKLLQLSRNIVRAKLMRAGEIGPKPPAVELAAAAEPGMDTGKLRFMI
jgi:sigma-54-specific transcriptional regulator